MISPLVTHTHLCRHQDTRKSGLDTSSSTESAYPVSEKNAGINNYSGVYDASRAGQSKMKSPSNMNTPLQTEGEKGNLDRSSSTKRAYPVKDKMLASSLAEHGKARRNHPELHEYISSIQTEFVLFNDTCFSKDIRCHA